MFTSIRCCIDSSAVNTGGTDEVDDDRSRSDAVALSRDDDLTSRLLPPGWLSSGPLSMSLSSTSNLFPSFNEFRSESLSRRRAKLRSGVREIR